MYLSLCNGGDGYDCRYLKRVSLIRSQKPYKYDVEVTAMRILLIPLTALMGILFFLSLAGVTIGFAYSDEDIQKLIESAETPEQHVELAEYYENLAAKMESEAKRHEAMRKLYEKRAKMSTHMPKHCSALTVKYKEAAKEYKYMAELHRDLAENDGVNE